MKRGGGGGGGTDLQILGFQMGVEEVQKWQITVKTALWGELQGVKLLQKVRFFFCCFEGGGPKTCYV